jgi:Family of unknown function (DUF6152)
MKPGLVLASVVLAAFAAVAAAHHSTANFDNQRVQVLKGTVKYFGFTNPHSFIDIEGTTADATGKAEAFKVFTVGRVLLVRYGWQVGDLKPGDVVTVTGHPDRQDGHFMYLTKITFADGKVWERQTIEE